MESPTPWVGRWLNDDHQRKLEEMDSCSFVKILSTTLQITLPHRPGHSLLQRNRRRLERQT